MNKKFSLNGFQLFVLLIVSVLIGYIIGIDNIKVSWKNYQPIANIQSKNPPPSSNLDMSTFYNVLDKVNKDYYDKSKIDSQKVLYGAITGMLQSLDDPYTSFFPPKENTSFKTDMAGQFEGIGAELGMSKDNRIIVVSPLDGSPAVKAGIKAGDAILKVDGEDTFGWSLSQAVDKIRGQKDTKVTLSIAHEGSKKPQDIEVIRGVITVKTVTSWIKPVSCSGNSCKKDENCTTCAEVAYIRLSQFGDKTNDEWTSAVNSIYPEINNQKNFKGIILDLRNNPGGYLTDAVFVASEFLKDGVVVMQEDSTGAKNQMSVSRKGVLTDYPIVVLVNKGSASASEIVAGALHDHNRAKIVGEKTFGKGTIQEAVELGNGSSVHVTVAKWLTPKGTWVHKNGIEPDVNIPLKSDKVDSSAMDNQLQSAIQELTK